MKRITLLLAIFVALMIFVACGGNNDNAPNNDTSNDTTTNGTVDNDVTTGGTITAPESHHINMAVLPGPSAIGSLLLMDAAVVDNDAVINTYNIQVLGSPEEVGPMLAQGLIDIAAVPTNMASVLYNNLPDGVTVLALSTMGVLHILDTTGEISSMEDLRGRTIHLSGMGAAPELALNYVLTMNNLEPNVDVYLEFHGEQPQIAALLSQGVAEIALLPEPFATTVLMQNEHVSHALDLTEEWGRVQPDYGLVMTAIVVRNAFLAENPQAIENFLNDFAHSISFVQNNVDGAAALAVEFGIIPNENIANQAIPRTNQVFITGADMERYIMGYLTVLHGQLPQSVGGSLPSENFFYRP
ncbi:MAG: ABC transporter substrate-binding protein [Defluviitaleaceae bacterium]|nr:ABC transporter substrate-binding protein [Defluviitaleaceae bacterium]